MKDKQREAAKLGGLQDHSIGGPYPWIVVGIENPSYIVEEEWQTGIGSEWVETTKHLEGTFYYVQNPDGTIGSKLFKFAATAHQRAAELKDGRTPVVFTRKEWAGVYGH